MMTPQRTPQQRIRFIVIVTLAIVIPLGLALPFVLGFGFISVLTAPGCGGGQDPAGMGWNYEDVSFPSSEFPGQMIPAYWIAADEPSELTVIVVPTSGGRGERLDEVAAYRAGVEARLRQAGFPMVPLLAPTTTPERAAALLAARPDPGPKAPFAQRFAYVVARLGVTGAGSATDLTPVQSRMAELRRLGVRPLAVGFGLSSPEALAAVRAQGATPVVGSALVQALHEGQGLGAFLAHRT